MKLNKFLLIVFLCLLTGCQAECEVQKHSDEDYVKLMSEYSKLEDKYEILEDENTSLKNSKATLEKKYMDALAGEEYDLEDHLTDLYSYVKDNTTYYVSSCYGVTFYIDQELPVNFYIKDNKEDGYFGVFYKDGKNIEPVHVFMVMGKESIPMGEKIPAREIFHEYDNGLCVINSLVGFNGSNISYNVWDEIINPFIEEVTIHFE